MDLSKDDENALITAFLYDQVKNQESVKNILSISQSQVSKNLKLARKNNWLYTKFQWPENLAVAEQQRIVDSVYKERPKLEQALSKLGQKQDGISLSKLSVFHLEVNLPLEEQRIQFGHAVADYIASLFGGIDSCAVAWGRTIQHIVNSIQSSRRPAKPALTFIPIAGEPLNSSNDIGISPSIATATLRETFSSKKRLSLRGIPARIPKNLADGANIIREFVSQCDDYHEIFDQQSGLMNRVDMILSGVGDAATSHRDPWYLETAKMEDMKNLDSIALGNIGGVWISQDLDNKQHTNRVQEMNNRWLGIQEKHFRKCAERAANGKYPGVVIVAVEPDKAKVISRVMGMVNHLVVSKPLAEALYELPEIDEYLD